VASWDEINAQVQAEFACNHARERLALRVTANGKKQFVRQCIRCGQKSSALKHAELTQADMDAALPVDDELQRNWWQQRADRYQELRDKAVADEKEEWQRWYDAYLQTPKWKAKSRRILQRDPICQACLMRPSVQAHHLSYKHVGDEPLFDLVGVCLECHRKLHDPDQIAYGLRNNFQRAGILA
jgi:hypothetical protein